jgi:transposase
VQQLLVEFELYRQQLLDASRALTQFAKAAPAAEAEARAVLESIPGVGPVTTDVVVAELGLNQALPPLLAALGLEKNSKSFGISGV